MKIACAPATPAAEWRIIGIAIVMVDIIPCRKSVGGTAEVIVSPVGGRRATTCLLGSIDVRRAAVRNLLTTRACGVDFIISA
jgi:hypothetical protein